MVTITSALSSSIAAKTDPGFAPRISSSNHNELKKFMKPQDYSGRSGEGIVLISLG
jgi:hypothetical protein